jgi:hypothetical protein
MTTRQIRLGTTDGEGAFERTVSNMSGVVRAVGIVLGSLDSPDITLVDGRTEAPVLELEALAADGRYQPMVLQHDHEGAEIEAGEGVEPVYGPPVLTGSLTVTITGGGDTKSGTLYVVLER